MLVGSHSWWAWLSLLVVAEVEAGGGQFPADNLLDDLVLMAHFTPSGLVLSTQFESLCFTLAKAPGSCVAEVSPR